MVPTPLLVLVQLPERKDPAWGLAGRALLSCGSFCLQPTKSQGHRLEETDVTWQWQMLPDH